ncbi:MAG: hypothetical protein M1831_005409 [Alyxoria varia]|nr:MAG: hypothetical protein M1831_005409 [Alyxoria varia]
MDPLNDNSTPASSGSTSTAQTSEPSLSRRKNPPRLDLSKLFPRRKTSPQAPQQSSHRRPSNNSSTSTANSADISSSQSTPSSWSNRLMGANPCHQAPLRSPKAPEMKSPKINVRRPPPGIKHWFDGLADEWADSDEALMPETHEAEDIRRELDGFSFSKNQARDTFLSMSTMYLEQPLNQPSSRNTEDTSKRRTMSLQRPPSGAPTQSDRTGDTSSSESTERQSQISNDTVRHEVDHERRARHPGEKASQHSQASTVFQGHSILVLSDPDDSDDGADDEPLHEANLAFEGLKPSHIYGQRLIASGSASGQRSFIRSSGSSGPQMLTATNSFSRQASATDSWQEPSTSPSLFSPRPSTSSGATSSHGPWLSSPSTSLRSPASSHDLSIRESNNASIFSGHQSQVSDQASPPMEKIARAFPKADGYGDVSSQTHQLMAVTPEEARLLASMRAKQASSHDRQFPPTLVSPMSPDLPSPARTPNTRSLLSSDSTLDFRDTNSVRSHPLDDEDSQPPPFLSPERQPSMTTDDAAAPHGRIHYRRPRESSATVFTDIEDPESFCDDVSTGDHSHFESRIDTEFKDRDELQFEAFISSPTEEGGGVKPIHCDERTARQSQVSDHNHSEPHAKRPTTEVVTRVWEDVQTWRKHAASSEDIEQAEPASASAVLDMSPPRPMILRNWVSEGGTGLHSSEGGSSLRQNKPKFIGTGAWGETRWSGLSHSSSKSDCEPDARGMDNKKREEAANDVLAAWNDLGGLARPASVISRESFVASGQNVLHP